MSRPGVEVWGGGRGRWALWSAFLALFVFGAALRLTHYLDRRSLWLDESMLALNISARSFGELLLPLDYHQSAPPLFLWIERLLVVTAGVNELALRAFPMAAGVALLAWLWVVARRLSGEVGALAALALAAFAPALIRFANEAKPYGTDALATVALLHAALAVKDQPGSSRRWWILLVAGWIGVLVSLPAVFVAGAVVPALTLDPSIRRRQRGWVVACAAAWGATVALLYFLLYRPVATNPYQHQGYEAAFLFLGPGFGAKALLALRGTLLPTFVGTGTSIPPLSSTWLWLAAAAALVLGLAFLARRNGAWAPALVAGPLLLAALASAVRRYPLGVPRLMVFASPLLVLMAASAASWFLEALRSRAKPALLAFVGAGCLAPMALARVEEARNPFRGEEAAHLVSVWRRHRLLHEPTYIGARGIPSWLFYTTNWEEPNRERLAFYARAATTGPSFENAPPRGRPVVNEGVDLVYQQRQRREILGIATGRQWRWPQYATSDLDEGWAANEAARIAREANPCVWLYFTRLSERANKPITWHLRDDYHASRDFFESALGGVLYRYCLPDSSAAVVGAPSRPAR